MALVTALRQLWRCRLLVALCAVGAIAVGIAMTYRVTAPFSFQSRQYQVGIASARALVDTPSSQLVDLGGKTPVDIGTLSARANLLASLMTSSPIKDEIAQAAGIPVDALLTPAASGPANAPKDVSGTVIGESDPRANILRASVPVLESGSIPIIAVGTQAPDPKTAARLADQAIRVLRMHVDNVAGTEDVPLKRRVTVRELGAARSTVETRGPGRFMAIFAGLLTFAAGCGMILLVVRLVSGLRSATELERFGVQPPMEDGGPLPAHGAFVEDAYDQERYDEVPYGDGPYDDEPLDGATYDDEAHRPDLPPGPGTPGAVAGAPTEASELKDPPEPGPRTGRVPALRWFAAEQDAS